MLHWIVNFILQRWKKKKKAKDEILKMPSFDFANVAIVTKLLLNTFNHYPRNFERKILKIRYEFVSREAILKHLDFQTNLSNSLLYTNSSTDFTIPTKSASTR